MRPVGPDQPNCVDNGLPPSRVPSSCQKYRMYSLDKVSNNTKSAKVVHTNNAIKVKHV